MATDRSLCWDSRAMDSCGEAVFVIHLTLFGSWLACIKYTQKRQVPIVYTEGLQIFSKSGFVARRSAKTSPATAAWRGYNRHCEHWCWKVSLLALCLSVSTDEQYWSCTNIGRQMVAGTYLVAHPSERSNDYRWQQDFQFQICVAHPLLVSCTSTKQVFTFGCISPSHDWKKITHAFDHWTVCEFDDIHKQFFLLNRRFSWKIAN
jgi:hypothetical protein